jgi:hypothetical protein
MGREQTDRQQTVRQSQDDSRRHPRHPSQIRRSAADIRQKSAKSGENVPEQRRQLGLVRFFRRYPLALLTAAWIGFLLIAIVAFRDMTSLDTSNPQVLSPAISSPIAVSPDLSAQPAEIPIQISPTPEPSPKLQSTEGSLPILSLVAIALSCAVGCMIILQALKPRRPPERSHSSAFSKPAASRRSKALGTRAVSKFQQTIQPQLVASADSAIIPSVVPSDISQPLDWDEPSLADNLDLRQRRPLSHWL